MALNQATAHALLARMASGEITSRELTPSTLDRIDENEPLGIKQAFFNLPNGGFIEVVAPTDPEGAVGRALEKRGEGIHTLAMEVDDMEATVAALKAGGAQLIGEGGPQVFVHPKSTHGILIQLTKR